ncbi:hypothetical protein ACH42_01695 [Endozoicomonas sp. (ex Bugula neritina AB1)]|nr:hypothetical protein ACH42_01695 [Endozoicomonas sp. (ex Bugula neritina AB1)]
MSKSLRDQLMGAGLATKQQALKAKTKTKKNKQQARKSGEMTEQEKRRIELEKNKQAQIEKDRDLNRQLEDERKAKALEAQVRQLIEMNAVSRIGGEVEYKFVVDKKIKKIYVTDDQLNKLGRGLLAVGVLGEDFAIIPSQVAAKISERMPEAVVAQEVEAGDLTEEEKDWYADFEIPDDLMW